MRKTRQETVRVRGRIVEAASLVFRRNGIGATSIANFMAAAGMTHGGFYKYFYSKDQVVKESVVLATDAMIDTLETTLAAAPGKPGRDAIIAEYLSNERREAVADACPFVGLGIELSRADKSVRDATTAGFVKLMEVVARSYDELPADAAHQEALLTLSMILGAATMARIVNDQALSQTILQQARLRLTQPPGL